MDNKTFTNQLAERLNREPEEISLLIRKLGEAIAESVRDGDTVTVPTFGTFEQKKRMERITVHPSTGKRILVPPKISLVFKPSTLLKQKVRNNE
jgi:DNA-binding protein HU-beta/integration host factor subunit alpha